jgi:predicted small secreted protein
MKALIATAAAALMTLSACNAPEGDGEDEERTEQRDGGDEDDD